MCFLRLCHGFQRRFQSAVHWESKMYLAASAHGLETDGRILKTYFLLLPLGFTEVFQKAYDGVKNIWDGLGEFFKGIARNALSPIETLVNGIINGVNWVMEKVGV